MSTMTVGSPEFIALKAKARLLGHKGLLFWLEGRGQKLRLEVATGRWTAVVGIPVKVQEGEEVNLIFPRL